MIHHSWGGKKEQTRQVYSNVKVMLTISFHFCYVLHHNFAPQGKNITTEYYLETIHHLHNTSPDTNNCTCGKQEFGRFMTIHPPIFTSDSDFFGQTQYSSGLFWFHTLPTCLLLIFCCSPSWNATQLGLNWMMGKHYVEINSQFNIFIEAFLCFFEKYWHT